MSEEKQQPQEIEEKPTEVTEPVVVPEVDAKEEAKESKKELEQIKAVEKTGDVKLPPKEDPLASWNPKTELGRKVKSKEIKSMSAVLDLGKKVLESEIIDFLMPTLETDLLLIGQAKGKFGGGQRRVFKQTQKKTSEGNKPSFSTLAVVGNKDGYVGIGHGKAKETVPSREKAFRKAKLSLIKIKRARKTWEGYSKDQQTVPFNVTGKCGSCSLTLMPAPPGTGLRVEKECAKVLAAAGIVDCFSRSSGHTKTKINLLKACFEALKKLSTTKVSPKLAEELGIVSGAVAEN